MYNLILTPYIVSYDPERFLHNSVPEHSIKFNFHGYLNIVKKIKDLSCLVNMIHWLFQKTGGLYFLLPCLLTHTGWELTRPIVILLTYPHWRANQTKARITLIHNRVSVSIVFSNDLTVHYEFWNSTVTRWNLSNNVLIM